jgi:hypothetical protein
MMGLLDARNLRSQTVTSNPLDHLDAGGNRVAGDRRFVIGKGARDFHPGLLFHRDGLEELVRRGLAKFVVETRIRSTYAESYYRPSACTYMK